MDERVNDTEIQSELQLAKVQLKDTMEFIKDLLIFGAFIFSVLFNMFYLAVERDYQLKDAYLVVQHWELVTQAEVLQALQVIKENIRVTGERLLLCEEDFDLIKLERESSGQIQTAVRQVLRKKFSADKDWDKIFVKKLSRAGIPYYVPNIEKSILYYAWIIEILALIFLSQTIRKKHVRIYLFQCVRKFSYFIPVTFLLLLIPFLKVTLLSYPNIEYWIISLSTAAGTLLFTILLFILVRKSIREKHMTDLGLYILISSLFVQFLGITGDFDTVYATFGNSLVPYVRYATWFILLVIPIVILDKIRMAKKLKNLKQ